MNRIGLANQGIQTWVDDWILNILLSPLLRSLSFLLDKGIPISIIQEK